MSKSLNGPDVDSLRGFLLGTLSPEDSERVSSWVAENPSAATNALRDLTAADVITAELSATIEDSSDRKQDTIVEKVIQSVTRTIVEARPDSLSTPIRVGEYQVVRELGRGGMGIVYEAVDDKLGRRVAIKLLNATMDGSESAQQRLLREAKAVAAVKSDHVVNIYQVGEANGVPFLAMEYLEGETLDDWLKSRKKPVSVHEVLWVARDVLSGLAAAHAKGLIHRDIKPGNLWVERETGRVKLLDFGLTRGKDSGDAITRDGAVIGTPAYMAPEQGSGKQLDVRADLFSVGVVLYRMLAGKSPFQRDSVMATLYALATEAPEPVREVHPELSGFIARLMAKDPATRPADAKSALVELRSIEARLGTEPVSGIKPATIPLGRSRRPLHKLLIAAGLLGALSALALLVQYVIIRDKDGKEVAKVKVPEKGKADVVDESGKTTPLVPVPKKDDPAVMNPRGPFANPLDALDSSKIPVAEKFPWQPKELVAVLGEHRQRSWGFGYGVVSTDGKQIFVPNSSEDFVVWDIATQKETHRFKQSQLITGKENFGIGEWSLISFTPDGRRGITANGVWDITGAEPKQIVKIPGSGLGRVLRFTQDGKTAITSGPGQDSFVTLWDVSDSGWKIRHRFAKNNQFSLSPSGTKIAVGAEGTGTVKIYSLEKREHVETCALPLPTSAIFYDYYDSPTMGFVGEDRLVTLREGTLRLWDVSGMQPRELAKGRSDCDWRVLVNPATKRIIAVGAHGIGNDIWDADGDNLKLAGHRSLGDRVGSNGGPVAITPDGKVCVSTHLNGSMRFWDVGEKELVERNPIVIQPSSGLNSFNGRYLFTNTEDGKPKVWDLGSTTPIPVADPNRLIARMDWGRCCSCRFSPNGKQLIVGGDDSYFRFLEIFESDKDILRPYRQLTVMGTYHAWSPDSNRVVVATRESLIAYDLTSDPPRELGEITQVEKQTASDHGTVFFTGPDGKRFVTHAADRVTGQWQLRSMAIVDGTIKELARVPELGPKGNLSEFGRAAISTDHKTLLVPSGSTLQIWDVAGDIPKIRSEVYIAPVSYTSLQLLADNRTVAFSGGNMVGLLDLEKKRVVRSWQFPGGVQQVIASTDGRYLITGNANGTIYVLRLATLPK